MRPTVCGLTLPAGVDAGLRCPLADGGVDLEHLLRSRRRRGGGGCGSGGALGLGDAEHRLAMLAFHELAADFIRHREDLATAKVWTDDLTGHNSSPLSYRSLEGGA